MMTLRRGRARATQPDSEVGRAGGEAVEARRRPGPQAWAKRALEQPSPD